MLNFDYSSARRFSSWQVHPVRVDRKVPESMHQDSEAMNRRTEERVAARFEVRFNDSEQAARALRAYSINMSTGGLCLRTRRLYRVGTQVKLAMNVAGEPFQLQAVVAWVRDDAVGVRFTDLDDQNVRRLEQVVASLPR